MAKYNKLSHKDTSIIDYTFNSSRDPMWETIFSKSYDNYLM